MRVRTYAQDNLWLCPACHGAAIGDDETIIDQGQAVATENGLIRLGTLGELVPDYDLSGDGEDPASVLPCACCGTGRPAPSPRPMRRFAILGPSQELLDSASWQELADPIEVHADGFLEATFQDGARADAEGYAAELRAIGARNVTITPDK